MFTHEFSLTDIHIDIKTDDGTLLLALAFKSYIDKSRKTQLT